MKKFQKRRRVKSWLETHDKIKERSPEVIEKRYLKMVDSRRNDEYGIGLHDEEYEGFTKEVRQEVFERDGGKCVEVNCDGEVSQLHYHHVDYDKSNSIPENICLLCARCHVRTNVNRDFWKQRYQEYIKVRYYVLQGVIAN